MKRLRAARGAVVGKYVLGLALAAGLVASAFALPGLSWRLLTPQVASGSTVQIRIGVVDGTGKPVKDAITIQASRVDMSPDGMASMTAPAKVATADGVVVVETNLYAPGRWAVVLKGTAGGKPVQGNIVVTAVQKAAAASPAPRSSHRILYYRNPMGLGDTSPVPKKDAMGMSYVPVYADDVAGKAGTVRLTTEKMQRAGVRTTKVVRMPLARMVRATGIVAADETRQAVLTARFSGFVEKLYVSQTGDVVRAGQPLMRVWVESPDVLTREADYVGSLQSHATADAVRAAGLLRQYGVAEADLKAMARGGAPTRSITIAAPATGTVMEKAAVQGMHFAAGDTLFKTTDVSALWVLAEVSERDLSAVKAGQTADISFRDDPAASFKGIVKLVYPEIDPATRTVKVRIAVANKNGALRIGQYADVRIAAASSDEPVLAVPATAVIDDGSRQIAFVALAGGLFEPRAVTLGACTADMIEIRSGLKAGDRVVVSGNFLIDAESNLQTALQTFGTSK